MSTPARGGSTYGGSTYGGSAHGAPGDPGPMRDAVDDLVDVVASVDPSRTGKQLAAKAAAYRLRRVAHRLELEMRRELTTHGVDLWELEILAALRRAPENRLSAGELMDAVALTSGTITHRISRVEDRGWVRRDPDPRDRRSVLVSLTPAGDRRATDVLAVKTEVENDVLGVLDEDTLTAVNDALRVVTRRLDHPHERKPR